MSHVCANNNNNNNNNNKFTPFVLSFTLLLFLETFFAYMKKHINSRTAVDEMI